MQPARLPLFLRSSNQGEEFAPRGRDGLINLSDPIQIVLPPSDRFLCSRSVGAHNLFDGMRPEKNGKDVAVASGSDSGAIDVLPDDILEHILGFLPAAEAVRTSVLARRWRHRWKFATALNVMCIMESYRYCWPKKPPVEECSKAGDDMLRLRGHTPLEACHLTFGSLHNKEDVPCLNRWVRHVVACQVQRFRLENFDYYNGHLMLDDLSLVSRHLTRLELIGLELNNELCDFSSCPALQHLDIAHCSLWNAKNLSSQSTESLSITSCNFIT